MYAIYCTNQIPNINYRYNIKDVSPTCFGTSVPSTGSKVCLSADVLTVHIVLPEDRTLVRKHFKFSYRAILQNSFFFQFGNTGADAAVAILLPTLTL
jgi:hypothetical protein